MDLYSILGVECTATAAQIKTAYRQRLKEVHPDHGGDRESFERVQQAYEVLKDPDKRKQYDLTGFYDDVEQETVERRAQVLLANLYDEVLNAVLSARQPERVDPLSSMEQKLDGHKQENEKLLSDAKQFLLVVEMVHGRMFFEGSGVDCLKRVTTFRREDLNQIIKKCEERRKDLAAAAKILRQYTYTKLIKGETSLTSTDMLFGLGA